jgi:RimJ/RimL family protein N-acetyltransferase
MLLSLRDGTRALIRPITADDKPLIDDGLRRLSPATVYRRFLGAKPYLSEAELRYLTEVDGRDHIALVAVDADDPSVLIGVARCVRLGDEPDTAEMAIVVGDQWQGLGLGHALAEMLAQAAAGVGIRRFAAVILADNVAARRLLADVLADLQVGVPGGGVSELVGELRAPG